MCRVKLDDTASKSAKKRRRESRKASTPTLPPGPSDAPSMDKAEISSGDQSQPRDYKMVTHYRPILCVDFLTSGELVVVERPLVDVLINLPPAYFRHKYGAS